MLTKPSPLRSPSLIKYLFGYETKHFIDVLQKQYKGKLIIIPTPIGNMFDISVNMYKKLFEVDIIGCEDRRVAGRLYKLMNHKHINQRLYESFGYSGFQIANVEDEQVFTRTELEFVEYGRMNDKKRRKFLSRMSVEEEKKFKMDYLKFRATKVLSRYNQFSIKTEGEDEMLGLINPETENLEEQILATRRKKGRGVMVSLNTYTESKLCDVIVQLLEKYKVGLLSDAGTPCISDPGFKVVEYVRKKLPHIEIESVKGPCAVSMMSSLAHVTNPSPDHGRYLNGYFQGFSKLLYSSPKFITDQYSFAIYFENIKRLPKVLSYISKMYGQNHKMYISGELTKKFERHYHDSVEKIRYEITKSNEALKGEISYIVYPKVLDSSKPIKVKYEIDIKAVIGILDQKIQLRNQQMAKIVTNLLGISKSEAMKQIVEVRNKKGGLPM